MKVQTLRPFGAALFQAALLMALSVTATAQITTTGIRGPSAILTEPWFRMPRQSTDNSTESPRPRLRPAMATFFFPTCSLGHTNDDLGERFQDRHHCFRGRRIRTHHRRLS